MIHKIKNIFKISIVKYAIFLVLLVNIMCLFMLNKITTINHNVKTVRSVDQGKEVVGVLKDKKFLINQPGCLIPRFDPWDPEVSQYFKAIKSGRACPAHPSILTISNYTTMTINRQIAREYYQTNVMDCIHGIVERNMNIEQPDDDISMIEEENPVFKESTSQNSEFIYAECRNHRKEIFYSDFKALVPNKLNVEKRIQDYEKQNKEENDGLSVMLFGIDSVSKLNFIRHMRKTYRYIKTLKTIELHGYTKVGENTIVNLVPLLTGQFVKESWKHKYFDEHNFIWKEFADNGYRTLYAEDLGPLSTFNYRGYGFKEPPTDYYFRPMANFIFKTTGFNPDNPSCVKDKMVFETIQDWVLLFKRKFNQSKTFSLAWTNSVTHERLNNVGHTDGPTYNYIKTLKESGHLNNTVLIFLSDHGMRWGDIVETNIGKYEERMPFMFLIFPDWFESKHPDIWKVLQENQFKLTTPFDIYKTQWDLIYLNKKKYKNPQGFGKSLFEPIPDNRTCDDAHIPEHFCVCNQYENIDENSDIVNKIAIYAVSYLNQKIEDHRHKCAHMTLKNIIKASVSKRTVDSGNVYRIIFVVEPSNGKFEATVSEKDNKFKISGSVTRINKYGNQSRCITKNNIRPICYCKFD